MAISGKRLRPLFTFACFVLGALAGNIIALRYFAFINSYLRGDSTDILWFIPQNPTRLTPADMVWLRAAFIIVGALVGFIVERLAFHQASKSRAKWHTMTPERKSSISWAFRWDYS